ncbi:hypothetical protein GNI_176250 [Gregarina niphandrodes]|uniref:F-box domain-containing protein n=1 Tax=Gregarina niphandrodes TaxID=110365 RepID=A0A023AXH0_GRENI|nr:hypothetical protein GNI_176250 [Gregarina niphandrodes]EZG43332.1 hypothetical protein GNI_176250 [Gregarina niphandrodes]|eukprot:XP_011133403.1 hypothetical protein GNI_176250 [Gregarina niphandrodes]
MENIIFGIKGASKPCGIFLYDVGEIDITRCIVKCEGRKEIRVQAFFSLKKDPTIKGRKQKSFSISKFGFDGAWSRANRCKEFVELVGRFPLDEAEIESAVAAVSGEQVPRSLTSGSLTPGSACFNVGSFSSGGYLPLPAPLQCAAGGLATLKETHHLVENILSFLSEPSVALCEGVSRDLRTAILRTPNTWRFVFMNKLPHLAPLIGSHPELEAEAHINSERRRGEGGSGEGGSGERGSGAADRQRMVPDGVIHPTMDYLTLEEEGEQATRTFAEDPCCQNQTSCHQDNCFFGDWQSANFFKALLAYESAVRNWTLVVELYSCLNRVTREEERRMTVEDDNRYRRIFARCGVSLHALSLSLKPRSSAWLMTQYSKMADDLPTRPP